MKTEPDVYGNSSNRKVMYAKNIAILTAFLSLAVGLASCVASRPTESVFPGYESDHPVTVEGTQKETLVAEVPPPGPIEPEGPALTLGDLYLTGTFWPQPFMQGRWAENGPILTYLNRNTDGGEDLLALNLGDGRIETLVEGAGLLSPDTGSRIVIEGYTIAAGDSSVLLFTDTERMWRSNTLGYYYLYDRRSKQVKPISDRALGLQMFAKTSPSGKRIGFVRNRDIFVADVDGQREVQVTESGVPGGVINGTYDWVYEEEFRQRDGWRWSPSGGELAFVQLDESATPEYAMSDVRPLYPELTRFKYPKAGEPNSEIRIGVFELNSGATRYLDTGTWNTGADSLEYLVGLGWTPEIEGNSYVWTIRLNRDQNRCELLFGDIATGSVRVVLSEEEPTWVEVDENADLSGLEAGKIRFLEDGQHFIWLSEVSGFRHLSLYTNTGDFVRQLTNGEWEVTGVHGVSGENLVITAAIDDATQRQAYHVPLAGGEPVRITSGEGWHDIQLSADGRFILDTFSTAESPPVVSLVDAEGTMLRVLEDNQRLRDILEVYDLPPAEFVTLPADDGTPLNAYIIKPTTFSPETNYPLLIHTYGGPGSQEVQKSWGGIERLWHKMLAEELGIIVVGVDNRGTGARGKAFKSAVYLKLGVLEAADQRAAARHFGALPYVDASRMAIWGWSYGAYVTLMAMLTGDGPELFSAGMAVAPVADWRLYDTIYTERFMSTPEKNPQGYRDSSPLTFVEDLSDSQRLLVAHGDQDDNVHFQNTVQLAYALQEADKPFEMMVYPGKTHSIAGGVTRHHLFRMLTDFLTRSLDLETAN